MTARFEAGRTYENVYLLVVDAAGYSTVVRDNPRDHAVEAFTLLRDRVADRVATLAADHGCAHAELWSWRGDGGMFAIHDDNESIALAVALRTGRSLVAEELDHVREHFASLRGELHVRVAVHKGTIRYATDSGAIHTPEINFAAHLEKVTPRDCLAISEEVHRVGGELVRGFEPVGEYEGRRVHVLAPRGSSARRMWLALHGFTSGQVAHLYWERPSQQDKARLVDTATEEVVDLGTALNTCAGYLTTTERPAVYRAAVLLFLERGGTYRCLVMDPDSPATSFLAEQRDEDVPARIRRSVARFAEFKERHGRLAENFQVHQVSGYPGLAALGADPHADHGILMYSPYLGMPPGEVLERGEMPHYLIDRSSGPAYETLRQVLTSFGSAGSTKRVL